PFGPARATAFSDGQDGPKTEHSEPKRAARGPFVVSGAHPRNCRRCPAPWAANAAMGSPAPVSTVPVAGPESRLTGAERLVRRTVGDAPKYAENSVGRSARVGRGLADSRRREGRRVPPLRKRG